MALVSSACCRRLNFMKYTNRFLHVFCIISLCSVASIAYAAPRFLPGETLNPGCLPTDASCAVIPLAASGVNSDITSLSAVVNSTTTNATTTNLSVGGNFVTTATNATATIAGGLSVAGSSGLTVLQSGYVGIGTTSPYAKLSIMETSGGTTPLFVVASSTNGLATSTALYIAANGNVGIGTSSPLAKLTVTGGQIFNSDGSISAPAYAFSGGTNTGIYRNSAGMGLTVGGSGIARFYSTFIGLDKNIIMQNGAATELAFQGTSSATTITSDSSILVTIDNPGTAIGAATFIVQNANNNHLLTVHDFGVLQLGNDAVSPVNQEIKSADNNSQGAGSDLLIKIGESSGSNASGGVLKLRGGQSTGSGLGGDIVFQSSPAGGSGSSLNSVLDLMTIKSSGSVGIGTSTPAFKFQVYIDASNEGHVAGTGDWARSSDVRLKKNILTLDGALDKVMQLRGVTYDWQNDAEATSSTHLGFIAQEVEQIFPEFVSAGSNGIKGVSYGAFTPVLVQAIKEQQGLILSYSGASSSDLLVSSSTVSFATTLTESVGSAWIYLAEKITKGMSIARELVAEKVTALVGNFGNMYTKNGSIETGLTTKDKLSGEYYCMYMAGGTMQSAKGKCEDVNPMQIMSATPVTPATSNNESTTTPSDNTSTSTPAASSTPSETSTPTSSTATSEPMPASSESSAAATNPEPIPTAESSVQADAAPARTVNSATASGQ